MGTQSIASAWQPAVLGFESTPAFGPGDNETHGGKAELAVQREQLRRVQIQTGADAARSQQQLSTALVGRVAAVAVATTAPPRCYHSCYLMRDTCWMHLLLHSDSVASWCKLPTQRVRINHEAHHSSRPGGCS